MKGAAIELIVNADDFGYFPDVSSGILDGLKAGVITATGIMANGPAFERSVSGLRDCQDSDAGVHLNATYGVPLTRSFPVGADGLMLRKTRFALEVLRGAVPLAAIADEWRAQLQKCARAGVQVRFLNSHEHVHMLPRLFRLTLQLAEEFGVPFVRRPLPEGPAGYGLGAAARSAIVAVLNAVAPRSAHQPYFVGLAPSGQLGLRYLERLLPRLKPGTVYELMCHPGRHDVVAAADPTLRHYHDWRGELDCLLSPDFRRLLEQYSVRLTRFRDLNRPTRRQN